MESSTFEVQAVLNQDELGFAGGACGSYNSEEARRQWKYEVVRENLCER